jgi:glycine dehydrogenase subunit 1
MGLDVSNASLYEGATALTEAILMAVRANRHNTSHRILIPQSVHPLYREVVSTIVSQLNIEVMEVPFNAETGQCNIASMQSVDFTAFVIPQPNFFGQLEEVDALTNWAHSKKALVIGVVNPLAMALIKPPGQWGEKGADIACGEGQPLGVPLASGGPYYGFLCCKKEWVRQLPGRIVGRTVDKDGKQGFVLTLQAREQHIRRAKATSNICTNQGLLVTASTIYMSLLGPVGLREVAIASQQGLRLLKEKIADLPNVKVLFSGPCFHEMVLQFSHPLDDILEEFDKQHIAAGLPLKNFYPALKNSLLVCVTETKTVEDIERFAACLQTSLAKYAEMPLQKISGE